jgi:hypothetical protein
MLELHVPVYSDTDFQNKIAFALITSYGKQIICTRFSTLRRTHVNSSVTDKYSNIHSNLHEEVCRRFKDVKETENNSVGDVAFHI